MKTASITAAGSVFLSASKPALARSHEKRLIHDLLHTYAVEGRYGRPEFNSTANSTEPPTVNTTEVTVVNLYMSIVQLLQLDEKSQVLTTSVSLYMLWRDPVFLWDPADYGGYEYVRIPRSKIWYPDVMLENSVMSAELLTDDLVVVEYIGNVMWAPRFILYSSCEVNVYDFPFDRQKCKYIFKSGNYDGWQLDVNLTNGKDSLDTSTYIPSKGWKLAAVSSEKLVQTFPGFPEPYPQLQFHVEFVRTSGIYSFVLVTPSLLLCMLTFLMFLLPQSSSERVGSGLTIFMSYFMLLLILIEITPNSSNSIPRLGQFLCINLIIIALSVLFSMVSTTLTSKAARGKPVPPWIDKVFVQCLGTLLCVCPQDPPREEEEGVSLLCDKTNGLRENSDSMAETMKAETAADPPLTNLQATDPSLMNLQSLTAANPNLANLQDANPTLACLQVLQRDVSAIARYVGRQCEGETDKVQHMRAAAHWTVVSLVVDRLLFVGYLVFTLYALIKIFPWPVYDHAFV